MKRSRDPTPALNLNLTLDESRRPLDCSPMSSRRDPTPSWSDLDRALPAWDQESPDPNEPGDDLIAELVDSWKRGRPVAADEVLRRHPECEAEAAIRLVFEEVVLKRDAGIPVDTDEFLDRHPAWRRELEVLLACERALRTGDEVRFPEVGERLGGFQLLAELGRGGAGRTFLASQPDLADRLVVLKVTTEGRAEHLTLARLQHTHIVPLYSEKVFEENGLHGLCMPYFGGVDLSVLFDRLATIPLVERSGQSILAALDATAEPERTVRHVNSPGRRFLQGASYEQAVCWIAACLAEALRHAHELGLVHMDIKPSNVLLTDDGRPMLLDFHMARRPLLPLDSVPGRLGGTAGWMSPEQVRAGQAIRQGRPITEPVDDRTDVYSLGLLMKAALGEAGRPGAKAPVSQGMRAMIGRCTQPDQADRYPSAALLLDDLKSHLLDLPLRGVRVRSWSERWAKWRRRRPQALSRWVIALLGLVILAFVGSAYLIQHDRVIDAIEVAGTLREGGKYEESLALLERARRIALWLPAGSDLRSKVEDETRLSLRARLASELHLLATQLRFRTARPDGDARSTDLDSAVQTLWDHRGLLLSVARDHSAAPLDGQLREDLRDLAIGWAEIQRDSGRLGPALATLDRAVDDLGDDGSLVRVREAFADPTGDLPHLPPPGQATARDLDNLGRLYLGRKRFDVALEAFQRSIEEAPSAFWPHYYRGVCSFELHRYRDALEAFQTCLALDPTSATCLDHQARTLEELGRSEEAARARERARLLREAPPIPTGNAPRPGAAG